MNISDTTFFGGELNMTTEDNALAYELILRQQLEAHRQKEDHWNSLARRFGICYIVLGILAIIVNIVIFTSIILRRRHTFSQVFYIIILNFTIIDTIKGVSSILFAIKHVTSDLSSESSWAVIVDQYGGVLLRFTNLTTIMNVLLITLNEFIFICYPLRYSSIVTKHRVLISIVSSWFLAAFLVILNMWASFQHKTFMIDDECKEEMEECLQFNKSSLFKFFLFHLMLVVFCLTCLAVTVGCYLVLFKIISNLMKSDAKFQAEVDLLNDENPQAKNIARRRKYVLMIGSVIVVYTVFLVTYAVIQTIHVINIRSRNLSDGMITLKFVCYLFISFHSLLQPFCFMRMKEFRNILKRTICGCLKPNNPDFRRSSFRPTEI
ncbi:unnamed protein product [Caenorhabditis angaria]|uniref:G-protein coupled receptors family 1 profile domain-containing protein n=1 Tax=Caenorhabditis angaria TaxID=860376 RepID=A0A9P1I4W8_9PELO|nr:unnamed protein product [Caenorhabditis angaria]